MPELRTGSPSLEQRLMELFYGGDRANEYLDWAAKERLGRLAELEAQQQGFSSAEDKLTAPIPGGNPEVPTGADALLGALMSMGGVPPTIARSGIANTIKKPVTITAERLPEKAQTVESAVPDGYIRLYRGVGPKENEYQSGWHGSYYTPKKSVAEWYGSPSGNIVHIDLPIAIAERYRAQGESPSELARGGSYLRSLDAYNLPPELRAKSKR